MNYKFITIEGNIGAGKTTLAKMIAQKYNGKLVLETFVENPFLADFLEGNKNVAFQAEMYFLADRFHQIQENFQKINHKEHLYISDYIFEKSLLYAKQNINKPEFELFERMFKILYPALPQPELMIYLHSQPKRLLKNIKKRGRTFETKIDESYLSKIDAAYFKFFEKNKHLKILIIKSDNIDFVANQIHFNNILELIELEHKPGIHQIVI